jgi:hypothetical protein
MPVANSMEQLPRGSAAAFQEFAAQFAVSIVVALFALRVFFPDNTFIPFPWQHDDYKNFSGYLTYHPGQWIQFYCVRPVSSNIVFLLGERGETTFYVVMFLLTALLPVLAVRLAIRLYRFRPGPWLTLWLVAEASFFTFLCEYSLWFYRYTGLMTNLTSLAMGMMAASCFCRWLDGKKCYFAAGCLWFLGSAFAKEDLLLFVPLFVTVDWFLCRREGKDRPGPRALALAYGWFAVVGAALYCWNTWIVPSPFTSSTSEPYKLNLSISHIAEQVGSYASLMRTPRVLIIALAVAVGLGILRRRFRLAAIVSVLLTVSLILPYSVLPRFTEYYCLNWLSIVAAMALIGIALAWRPYAPDRFAFLPWFVPGLVMAVAVLWSPSRAEFRADFAAFLNDQQESDRFIVEQLVRRREEFIQADTIALLGLEDHFSPWMLNDGLYINSKVGKNIHWLLVSKPNTIVAQYTTPGVTKMRQIEVVTEQDLKSRPGMTVLRFDKKLNLSVLRGDASH